MRRRYYWASPIVLGQAATSCVDPVADIHAAMRAVAANGWGPRAGDRLARGGSGVLWLVRADGTPVMAGPDAALAALRPDLVDLVAPGDARDEVAE